MSKGTLYGFAVSPFVRAVRIALHEKDIAYHHEPHGFDEVKSAGYAAINPFRKMPAWVAADGFTVYETPAILRWLDEGEAGVSLTPAAARDRATMAQWVGVAGSFLYPVGILQLVWQRIFAPLMGGTTDEAILASATAALAGHLDAVDAALSGTWLAGPAISQADIVVGVMLDLVALTPEGSEVIATLPATRAFLARLRSRDSFEATFPDMLADRRRA